MVEFNNFHSENGCIKNWLVENLNKLDAYRTFHFIAEFLSIFRHCLTRSVQESCKNCLDLQESCKERLNWPEMSDLTDSKVLSETLDTCSYYLICSTSARFLQEMYGSATRDCFSFPVEISFSQYTSTNIFFGSIRIYDAISEDSCVSLKRFETSYVRTIPLQPSVASTVL